MRKGLRGSQEKVHSEPMPTGLCVSDETKALQAKWTSMSSVSSGNCPKLSCEGETETGPGQHEAETVATSLKKTWAIPCSWNQPYPSALRLQSQNYELWSCRCLSYLCIAIMLCP